MAGRTSLRIPVGGVGVPADNVAPRAVGANPIAGAAPSSLGPPIGGVHRIGRADFSASPC
jgi:hypothetical protein